MLLKQAYVRNPDQTIEQLVAETAKALGSNGQESPASLASPWARAVDKGSGDFAAEVAALSGWRR